MDDIYNKARGIQISAFNGVWRPHVAVIEISAERKGSVWFWSHTELLCAVVYFYFLFCVGLICPDSALHLI